MKVKQKIEIEKELVERIKKLGFDPVKFVEECFDKMTDEDLKKIIESIKEEKKMIDIRNFIGQEKFGKIEIYNNEVMATDSYVAISVKKEFANYENIKIDYKPKIHTFIINNTPETKFELKFDRNQEIIEEDCCGCNGSGYEHKCECGANIMKHFATTMMYGLQEPKCKKCEDIGTRASTKDEEGAYKCTLCHGTGKQIRENEEMLKVGESYIKVRTLQKLLLYVGRDIQIFADGEKETPLFFKNDIACGLVASCRYKEGKQ